MCIRDSFEVINAGDKAYILCLFEKAPGKTVDIDNPEEFNEELFFHLGELMGEMHRLAVGYEDIIISPEFELSLIHIFIKSF